MAPLLEGFRRFTSPRETLSPLDWLTTDQFTSYSYGVYVRFRLRHSYAMHSSTLQSDNCQIWLILEAFWGA